MTKLILKDIQECITELEGGGKITTITYLKKLLAEVEEGKSRMISDIKERFRIDAAEAYDNRLDENITMIRAGHMKRRTQTEWHYGPDGTTYKRETSYPLETWGGYAGRVEAVKDHQKNKWAAGFGYGVLFVLGVVAFMALMLF